MPQSSALPAHSPATSSISKTRKKVLCPMERKGKTYWMRIGSAFENVDGSTNVYLDAYPANGKLQIRDYDERDEARRQGSDDGPRPATPF